LVALFALALVAQQPQVTASVDRSQALVGDIVTLTVTAVASGGDPVRMVDPILSGFEVRGSRQSTSVRIINGIAERTFLRELRLVALGAGTASIGPVRVRVGDTVVETASITVSVTAAAGARVATLGPTVRALLDSVSGPPPGSDVVVQVVPVPDSIVLGDQIDLVTLAWFPRDVRQQLRTPPTLTAPEVEGVWSYRQDAPPGLVASRQIGTRWYDLFINHQVLFPLTAGLARASPATVSYVLPLTYSFLSRELQHEVQSDSIRFTVSPQPVAGRLPGFTGAAASGLVAHMSVIPDQMQPGGAATATVTLRGVGNVALWPAPDIAWPSGLRVYPGEVSVELAPGDDRVAGEKRFTYLLVAGAPGTHAVPGFAYPYFDPVTGRYGIAEAAGVRVIAPPGTAPESPRRPPPPLKRPAPPRGIGPLLDRVSPVVWLILFLIPPVGVGLGRTARRIRLPRRRRTAVTVPPPLAALDALDRQFRLALARVVPDAAHQEGGRLAEALRASGLDPALATHAVRVRDRLRHAVFGPAGATDPDELMAEAHELLRALSGDHIEDIRRHLLPLAAALLATAAVAGAQERPEQLYDAGAVRVAADSFLARAAERPVATNWYNLGNALYRLGEDGRARVAWLRAVRLARRDGEMRAALALLPGDPATNDLTRVSPVSARELWLMSLVLWVTGWIAIAARSRRLGPAVALVAVLAAVGGWEIDRREHRPVGIVLATDVPLRVAPFGSARAPRTLIAGTAVEIERVDGAWMLVRRGDARGWVIRGEVTKL